MKVKNIELLNMNNTLNQFIDKKLPQRIGFAITKNLVEFSNELKCYNEQINKLFDNYKEYFEKDDDGNIKYNRNSVPVVYDSHREAFLSELNELLSIEVEINIWTIPEELFDYEDKDGRYDTISPKEMVVLQTILCARGDK